MSHIFLKNQLFIFLIQIFLNKELSKLTLFSLE